MLLESLTIPLTQLILVHLEEHFGITAIFSWKICTFVKWKADQ